MHIVLSLLLLFALTGQLASQTRVKPPGRGKNSLIDSVPRNERMAPAPQVKTLFERIERGIASANVGLFGNSFAKQVSLSIGGGESGYVSASQATSILQGYLSSHQPTQFSFSRMGEGTATPYATGRLDFVAKGNKESAQVYVALKQQDSEWVIGQFNIY